MKAIAERLEIIKVRFDLSYVKLGSILGVTKDQAFNYVKGKTALPLDKAEKLAEYFDLDFQWLVSGVGDPPFENIMDTKLYASQRREEREYGKMADIPLAVTAAANTIFIELFSAIKVMQIQLNDLKKEVAELRREVKV